MLDSARRKVPVPALARWMLGLGIAATLAANVAHGLGHGPVGAAVAAWPAVALVGSYELLMMVIRGSQAVPHGTSDSSGVPDPLQEQAAEVFADQLAADRVPSVRAIRAQLHVGQPRAQRLRDYLAAGAVRREEVPLGEELAGKGRSIQRPRLEGDCSAQVTAQLARCTGMRGLPARPRISACLVRRTATLTHAELSVVTRTCTYTYATPGVLAHRFSSRQKFPAKLRDGRQRRSPLSSVPVHDCPRRWRYRRWRKRCSLFAR
jgi:hypothetical protein